MSQVEAGAALLGDAFPGAAPAVRRSVVAAILLSDWSWALGVVGAGALSVDGRVPDLAPRRCTCSWTGGRVSGVAVASSQFTCGAADPDADHPDARVAVDLEAALRDALTAHLAPLHQLLRATGLLRQGSRSMWGAAGDGVATALRLHADTQPEPEPLLAVATDVLAGAPRAWGEAGFERVVDRQGREHLTRQRTSCCLYYRLPDTPACLTCPRTSAAERLERLRGQLSASDAVDRPAAQARRDLGHVETAFRRGDDQVVRLVLLRRSARRRCGAAAGRTP